MLRSILIRVPLRVSANAGAAMSEIITEEMYQLKQLIMQTISKRETLKDEMNEWYNRFPNERFAKLDNLIVIDSMLSELDNNYKRLWDFHNRQAKQA
ncbi:MAG: hypothetical protein LHW56_11285 [Candidatus Cloacimonetes bacterium]|nr:hypothetical protein [Candidatus Cloacimonadota bacterium]MDY0173474.1 hypothetical protein [Candidatus Cloacimonadaceae bacterium]